MDSPQIDFYIIAKIEGEEKHIKVIELETTDGVPYYSCFIGEKELSQIRKETYGRWEQLWGDLPIETVQVMGDKISEIRMPPL